MQGGEEGCVAIDGLCTVLLILSADNTYCMASSHRVNEQKHSFHAFSPAFFNTRSHHLCWRNDLAILTYSKLF